MRLDPETLLLQRVAFAATDSTPDTSLSAVPVDALDMELLREVDKRFHHGF